MLFSDFQTWQKQPHIVHVILQFAFPLHTMFLRFNYDGNSFRSFNCCLYSTECLLRNLYAGQEATVRTKQGTMDWIQIGKGVCQGCILSSCLVNLYAEYIIWNARLDEAQAGIKIAERNIHNLRYAHDTTLMTESKEELKSLLMKVKEESEKADLKLNKTQHSKKLRLWHPVPSLHGKQMGKQWK